MTRQIVDDIDWPCNVVRLYQDANVGLRTNISAAITTFLDREGEGIILEDDTLPSQAFFHYCDTLLERYRDDERVGVVSGYNPVVARRPDGDRYFFSELPMIWGWATWRRAWQGNNDTFDAWPGDSTGFPPSILRTFGAQARWIDNLERVKSGDLSTVWSYPFFYHCWVNQRLTAIPGRTLTVNIGFEPEATHTTESVPPRHVRQLKMVEAPPPLLGPERVEAAKSFDARILASYYKLGRAAAARQALVPLRNAIWRND